MRVIRAMPKLAMDHDPVPMENGGDMNLKMMQRAVFALMFLIGLQACTSSPKEQAPSSGMGAGDAAPSVVDPPWPSLSSSGRSATQS